MHPLLIASLLAACVKRLPPAPPPEPIAPSLPTAAAPPGGHGRLIVDVVEGPTPVERIRMVAQPLSGEPVTYQFVEAPEPLCTTPCATDHPAGNLLLRFPVLGKNATEQELVHVGTDASVYRRALSIYNDDTGALRVFGIVGTSVGGAALMTGAALLPIGLAKDIDGLTVAGSISLGVGAALLVIGILAMRRDAPTYRPGSANHFPLPTTP